MGTNQTTKETRRASYDAIIPKVKERSRLILETLGSRSMTVSEITDELVKAGRIPYYNRNYVAPRLSELKDMGIVETCGQQEAEPAEAEREQDIPTGAPIDMRRRKPEPRQQAEADPDPEAASRLIPGKDFDPVTGEIYEPEDDRRTNDGQTEEQPKNDGKIVVMERAAAQA